MVISKNKRAYFDYQIIEKYIAGIKLQGSEVKSIRDNKVSITEAYCFISNGEMFIKNMHVAEYKQSGANNHKPLRDRKLLLKKKEIIKLSEKTAQRGLTIIPIELILSDTGFIKLQIGLAKGKNTINKKSAIKDRDVKRELQRNFKV